MNLKGKDVRERMWSGLGVLTAHGMGRASLAAAAAAPFFTAKSPGASLLFILLPAYTVLARGDFSGRKNAEPGPAQTAVSPGEILARQGAFCIACAASIAASLLGFAFGDRLSMPIFASPWGLGTACVSATALLAAVSLPFSAAGRAAGRTAGAVVFAAAGIAAAVSAFRSGAVYATFLWILYSGEMPGLYPPLLAGAAALWTMSTAVAWGIARKKQSLSRLS